MLSLSFLLISSSDRSTFIDRDVNESANDRNDRAIRVATQWYVSHFKAQGKDEDCHVVLLTNDADNLSKAEQMGIQAYTGVS